MRPLDRALGKQHAIIGKDRDRNAPDVCETADEGAAIAWLEFVERRPVNNAANNFVNIIWRTNVHRHDAVKVVRVELWRFRRQQLDVRRLRLIEGRHDIAHDQQRVHIVLSDVVDNARFAPVRLGAAQLLITSPVAAFTNGGPPRKIVP